MRTQLDFGKQTEQKRKKMSISLQGVIMVIIASGMMACASLMLRAGIDAVGGFGGELTKLHEDIFALILQPIFILGVILYGSGTLLWMRVISTEPLSIGYPILVSFSFIVVSMGAAAFFKEPLTIPKLLGMGVILMGVIITSNG